MSSFKEKNYSMTLVNGEKTDFIQEEMITQVLGLLQWVPAEEGRLVFTPNTRTSGYS